ncbi:cytochrome P450 [Rhizophagus clarus]|uniref:Cytochrome P450 n=1 Tax=Rhizophagus clarus TaxID=94130 RepID=A0A8H3M8I0_9GLOM|nr:cytochrome P450 [Rhizophagus clarus]
MLQSIILASIILIAVYVLKRQRESKLNLAPLVPYNIPILGHTLSYMINCKNFIRQCREDYGDMFCLYLFGRIVTIVGKEHSHEVLSKDDVFDFTEEFRRRVPGEVMFANINGFGDPVYNVKIVKEFITKKLNLYNDRIQKTFYSATQKYIGGSDDKRTIYNLYIVMTKIVSFPISNILIGEEESIYDEVITTFSEFTTDISIFIAIPPFLDFIYPGLHYYMNRVVVRLGLFDPAKKHRDVLTRHVKYQVDKRLREKQIYGDSWNRPDDLLQNFMEEPFFNPKNIDYEALANRLSIFIFAAVHTTARVMANAIIDLASRPEYMQGLYEEQLEIRKKADENGILPIESLNEMIKLDSFLRESLRTIDDIVALPHYVLKDYTFSNGYQVQKGQLADLDLSDTHDDEQMQGENPESFDAYRHIDKNFPASKITKNFVSFGGGKHACPGRYLAVNGIKYFLHNLIINYNFRTESGKVEEKLRYGPLTMPSNNGIIFEKSLCEGQRQTRLTFLFMSQEGRSD